MRNLCIVLVHCIPAALVFVVGVADVADIPVAVKIAPHVAVVLLFLVFF